MLDGHHGDGEHLPLETQAQFGSRCLHCLTGLMLVDNFDDDARTCTSCGRCDFCPTPEVLAEPPSSPDPIRHLLPHAKRTKAVRGPAEGRLVRW